MLPCATTIRAGGARRLLTAAPPSSRSIEFKAGGGVSNPLPCDVTPNGDLFVNGARTVEADGVHTGCEALALEIRCWYHAKGATMRHRIHPKSYVRWSRMTPESIMVLVVANLN